MSNIKSKKKWQTPKISSTSINESTKALASNGNPRTDGSPTSNNYIS